MMNAYSIYLVLFEINQSEISRSYICIKLHLLWICAVSLVLCKLKCQKKKKITCLLSNCKSVPIYNYKDLHTLFLLFYIQRFILLYFVTFAKSSTSFRNVAKTPQSTVWSSVQFHHPDQEHRHSEEGPQTTPHRWSAYENSSESHRQSCGPFWWW